MCIRDRVLDAKGAKYVTETMWMLMEAGLEEVRLLQTLTLLATTNQVAYIFTVFGKVGPPIVQNGSEEKTLLKTKT